MDPVEDFSPQEEGLAFAHRLRRALRPTPLARRLADLVLPPLCIACRAPVMHSGTLCAACWRGLSFIAPPYCACCGVPFEYDLGEGALCGDCLRQAPAFDAARAALIYDEGSRALVMRFKHGDQLHLAPTLTDWLARAARELGEDADLIVPVPLHWRRRVRRRYNQAGVLAHGLGRALSAPVASDVLIRARATVSQGKQSRAQRFRNVKGAFAVTESGKARLDGARVLLVDDVQTTGATVGACAKTLRRAGAAWIGVVTLARVPGETT